MRVGTLYRINQLPTVASEKNNNGKIIIAQNIGGKKMLEYKTLRKYYEDAMRLKIALQISKCDKKDICEALAPIKKKIRTMYKLNNIKYYDYAFYNNDAVIETIKMPLMNSQQKQIWEEDNKLTICANYSPTGQIFTNYISFIDIPQINTTIILHSKSYDY